MKVFSRTQMQAADAATIKIQNTTSLELMERAGNEVFRLMHERLQGAQIPIHVFCGIGNNGGSGLVIARLLIAEGYLVETYIVNFSDKRSENFLVNYDRLKGIAKEWPHQLKSVEDFPVVANDAMVVDAILGVGLNRPLVPWVGELIKHINASRAFTLAVDIPSGLYLDKGPDDPKAVIYANTTLTFQLPKLVFFLPETGIYTQDLEVLNIGLDADFIRNEKEEATLISKNEVLPLYRPREKYAHKGTFGHVFMIGGSYGKIGSVILATKAALRIGSGLATSFIPSCGYTSLQTAVPEAMVLTDVGEKCITKIDFDSSIPTVVGIGPGLGAAKQTIKAFEEFLKEYKGSLVVDADGLNILAENVEMFKLLPEKTVLTPHNKELERLLSGWKDDFEKLSKAKEFSKQYDCIIVIKGANTITVAANELFINTSGNPGMATAGSGDVLTGVISGLIAQGYESLQAAVFGVYLHGSAADIAIQQTSYQGLLAGDILAHLGKSYLELFRKPQENIPQ